MLVTKQLLVAIVFFPYYESQNISNMVTLHVILVMLHRGHKVEALQGDTHERERAKEKVQFSSG